MSPSLPSQHPLRDNLTHEVHARPYALIKAPVMVSHLAMHHAGKSLDEELALLAELCHSEHCNCPAPKANHFTGDFSAFRLKWERHTEFSSYTFFVDGAASPAFSERAIDRVPDAWLQRLPGQLLVATHLALEKGEDQQRDAGDLDQLFASNAVAGSTVTDGAARAWTDYRVHADGFGRILVRDNHLRSRQAGRLVQRLLEIETYRMMALLALPAARRYTPFLSEVDDELSRLTERLVQLEGIDDERALLQELTELSARIEHTISETNYRFSASVAYEDIVMNRIAELREQRIAGLQTFQEFTERRLQPAMQTCRSVHQGLNNLSDRVAKALELLRTRVDITMEEQNRDLLISMDRRAKLQLHLQETVEGLSVVVLSYYSVSLLGYLFKGAKEIGLPIDASIATAASIPLVLGLVFFGLKRMRKRIMGAG